MSSGHAPASTYGALLAENARRFPGRPAILFEDRTYTWKSLDEICSRWARALIAGGIGRGDIVAVHAANRPEWLILAMACGRIGAVLAPLNTFHRDDEIAYQLAHSQASLLFVVERIRRNSYDQMWQRLLPEMNDGAVHSSRFPHLKTVVQLHGTARPGVLPLKDWLAGAAAVSDSQLADAAAQVTPKDDIYMLYTSGSTALPKGVRLRHGHSIANTFNIGERQGLNETDVTWIATPLFYGLSTINAIPAVWSHGGSILLQETFNAGESLELIERARPTTFVGLGNMIRGLYHHPDRPHRDISSLRKGIAGFSPEDLRIAIHGLGIERCCAIYGLTESYGNCFVTEWTDPVEIRTTTQGLPLPGWEYRIVSIDDEDVEVEPGELGTIHIRGYVTPGYFRNDDANADAFTDDGFFRTGDLGRVGSDGRFRFHSRIKEMMKIGGVNVSPLEVEKLIEIHPDVAECHVVGISDEAKGEVIAAVVVPTTSALEASHIQEFVAERAARFKVPAHVLITSSDQLPRVASGKVPKYRLRREVLRMLTADSVSHG